MRHILFSIKSFMAGCCLLSLQAAFATPDYATTCPSIEDLESKEGSFQIEDVLSFDLSSNTILAALHQHEMLSETEGYVFTLSGVPVAYGENIDDVARTWINRLQPDNAAPIQFEIANNRKNKNDHLSEDGPFNVCSYSVPNNPQVKGLFAYRIIDE